MSARSIDISKCVKCEATESSDGGGLRRCTRCLSVAYCSKDCQKDDWKRHKKEECKKKVGNPPGTSNKAISKLPEELGTETYRPVVVDTPTNVVCCCWCCGMLLKNCGPNATNPNQDIDGPYWTNTFGRINSSDDDNPVTLGRTVPAALVLGKPGSTGYYIGMNNHNQMTACLHCAIEFQRDNGKHAQAHIRKCEKWLDDQEFRQVRESILDINRVEKRMLARIRLEMNPDLSNGIASVAGYMTEADEQGQLEVPYNYGTFEIAAFPWLMANEHCCFRGKSSKSELHHYTMMRLYSADKSWREDSDYVVFSLYRLEAYGVLNGSAMLPSPWPISSDPPRESTARISIRPGFK